MRSWHIIAASMVAAAAAGAFLFLSGALPWGTGVAALLAHWPAIALVLLSTYATAALALTTLAAFLEVGSVTRRRSWNDRVRPYFVQLAVTQYFTSMLALLALGLSRIPVETALPALLPGPIGASPALMACGAVIVIGMLGGLLLLIASVVTGEAPEIRSGGPGGPGIRAGRLFGQVDQPASAPPMADAPVDAAEQPLPTSATTAETATDAVQQPLPAPVGAAADAELLAALIQQAQRPVLEAIRDLATSVNRLRRGLGEIKFVLQDRGSTRSGESDAASPSEAEEAAAQLRAVVAAVDASVARLGEMALLLSASETPVVTGRETPAVSGREAPTSPGSRARLSAELQALLRDLTPGADPPG